MYQGKIDQQRTMHRRRTEKRLVVRCIFYIPGEMATGGDVKYAISGIACIIPRDLAS